MGVALFFAVAPLRADTNGVLSLDAHVIAAGSSVRATAPCLRLDSTIAEPVAGLSASTNYALYGGFRAIAPSDELFFDGFEGCTP
jgi:hypothetical protein